MCTVIGTTVVFLWSAFRKLCQAGNLYISKRPVPACAIKTVNDAFWERVKATGQESSPLDGGVSFYTQMYTNRQEFRLKHFILDSDSNQQRTHYLTMISIKKGPREDFIMVQMNELFGMPRGCVATWVQSSSPPPPVSRRVKDCFDADPEHVQISGFWGKFRNDDCEAPTSVNDSNIFKGASMLRFFRKYSGFLSGVVLVRLASGKTGWTCTSKNDAAEDSKYVQDARRIWNALVWGLSINTSAIKQLYNEGVRSLWVETMSKRDQNHGAEVKNEGLVLTAMSYCVLPGDRSPFRKGTVDVVSMTNSRRIRFMARIIVNQDSKASVDQSCEAIAAKLQCQKVCCKHGRLYGDSLVMEMEASGWSDESHMQEARDCFGGEWENGELVRRYSPNEESTLAHLPDKTPVLIVGMDTVCEYLPFDGLASIVDTPITVDKPLIYRFKTKLAQRRNTMTEPDFQALLEECGIDSLSMHDHLLGSTLEGVVFQVLTATGEWVVVKYKFAPYVIRTMLLRKQGLVDGKYRRLGTVRTSPKGETRWCPSRSFAAATEDFVDRWVTRSDDKRIIRAHAVDMAEQFDALVEESASNRPSEDAIDDDTPRPGWLQPQLWIRAADRVTEGGFHRRRPMSAKAMQTFVEWHQQHVHVVVVLGPIGIGKSTTARQVAKHLKCKHVDTDELYGRSALEFSDERNAATISAIAQAVGEDGRVVVSSGGGPLGEGNKRKWECVLASQLEAMYPNIKVKTTVFMPSEEMGWSIADSPLSEEQLGRLYNNKQIVTDAVQGRVERRVWFPVIRKGSKQAEVSVRQFAEHIASLSKANLSFALKIQAMAGATCTYPPATGGNQSKLPKHLGAFLDTHCALVASPQRVVMLQQLRMLYLVDGKVYHETLRYGRAPEEFPLEVLSCVHQEDIRARQTAAAGECVMVTVPGADDTGCTLLVPMQDAPSDVLCVQQNGKRHVTLCPGKRPPATMKIVAECVRQGNLSCTQVGSEDFVDLEKADVCLVDVHPFAFIGL